MASLINAVFILLTLRFLAGLFRNLPDATLGTAKRWPTPGRVSSPGRT
jgi:hypothetical protein